MTAYLLQRDLAEEVEEILKDMLLKSTDGKLTHLKSFKQEIPKKVADVKEDDVMEEGPVEEDAVDEGIIMENASAGYIEEADRYPYCVVKIASGNMQMVEGTQQIETVLIFGIFDDDIQRQGHQVIMNMIHKIASRFTANPVLKDRYRVNEQAGISWVLDDEDRYPYYFGAMNMAWDTFFVGREEDRYV